LPSDGLFTALFVPPAVREAVSDEAWLQAMLDAERALAAAEAAEGVIPVAAAERIAAACRADRFDPVSIGSQGHETGNPVEPLVRALRAVVGGEAAAYVHRGATSQDILDTAASLVSRRALGLVLSDLDGVAEACAALADRHRSTLVAGRTLLQQALPTTFGLKAAGWLVGVLEARGILARARDGLAAELGGAAGTLASLGDRGLAVLSRVAAELELPEPVVPWHANRIRIAQLASALDLAAGALAKIGLDVVLLAQTEVAEVAEPSAGGRGGSSAMPHKRNPVGAVLVRAAAAQVHGLASVLTGSLAQEHERAAGGWQAEWKPLTDAIALTGAAAATIREVVESLEVDAERMRENLDAAGGLPMAEHVAIVLAERQVPNAHELVREICASAVENGRTLREGLAADPRVELTAEEIDRALDPAGYLGSAEAFVDRALALHREESR
jgi:3-carboxy-cis,cis-muconate cycloisomerase